MAILSGLSGLGSNIQPNTIKIGQAPPHFSQALTLFRSHEQSFEAETDTHPCIRNLPSAIEHVGPHGGGTKFQAIPAVHEDDAFTDHDRVWVPGVRQGRGDRTNFGMVNVTDGPIELEVAAVDVAGRVLTVRRWTVPGWRALNCGAAAASLRPLFCTASAWD